MSQNITDLPLFCPPPVEIPEKPDHKFVDLTGRKFHHLRVLYFAGSKAQGSQWMCECTCGRRVVARGSRLRSGATSHCGCVPKPRKRQEKTYPVDPTIVEQKCGKCGLTLPVASFYRRSRHPTGLSSECKKCRARYFKKYSAANREHLNRQSRKHKKIRRRHREKSATERLRCLYGITKAEYDAMLAAQGGVCKICGCLPSETEHIRKNRKRTRSTFGVDHDHATGKVRGITCQMCNIGLGGFRDNVETMRKAIAYLEESRRQAADG